MSCTELAAKGRRSRQASVRRRHIRLQRTIVITVAARVWVAAAAIGLAACGGASTTVSAGSAELPPAPEGGAVTTEDVGDADVASFAERMGAVDEAVAVWRDASTIEAAHEAAEASANLIVGPNGPDYGDRSGDGVVSGQSPVGLLPGLDGVPAGIAIPLSANQIEHTRCARRNVDRSRHQVGGYADGHRRVAAGQQHDANTRQSPDAGCRVGNVHAGLRFAG